MIIRKREQFMTEQEKQRSKEITSEGNAILAKIASLNQQAQEAPDDETAAKLFELSNNLYKASNLKQLDREEHEIENSVFQRYMESVGGSYDAILADIKEILEAFDESDFADVKTRHLKAVDLWTTGMTEESMVQVYLDGFLKLLIRMPREALHENGLPIDEAMAMVQNTLEKFTNPPTEEGQKYYESQNNFENYNPRYSKDVLFSRDRVSLSLWNGELSEEPKKLGTGSRRKKALSVRASVSFDEVRQDSNINIYGGGDLNAYDEAVHNAIVSLFVESKNDVVTPKMIYRTMTGDTTAKVTEEHVNLITKSIEKMSVLRVSINTRDEQDGYKKLKVEYKANLIFTESLTAKLNGVVVENCIRIIKEPILYTYASAKNHITRMPLAILRSPVDKSIGNIVLHNYLLKRIDMMKGNPNGNRVILYSKIFDCVEINKNNPDVARVQKVRTHKYTIKILDFFVSQGLISGYKDLKNKKAWHSITIEFKSPTDIKTEPTEKAGLSNTVNGTQ